jgi:hypothetical protein
LFHQPFRHDLFNLTGVRRATLLHFGIDPLALQENLKGAEPGRGAHIDLHPARRGQPPQRIRQTGSLLFKASGFAVFDDDPDGHTSNLSDGLIPQ